MTAIAKLDRARRHFGLDRALSALAALPGAGAATVAT